MYSLQNFIILLQPMLIAFLQGAMNSRDAVIFKKKKSLNYLKEIYSMMFMNFIGLIFALKFYFERKDNIFISNSNIRNINNLISFSLRIF